MSGQSAAPTPRPERVAGHIRVLGSLGEGGMGEVFVGYDERLERRVALKTIHHEHRLDPWVKARFLREARVLSQLDHPNICRIHDYEEAEDRDFLVLEMVEGETLQKVLERGLDEGPKLAVAEQVTSALAAAHARGIVHRDLKPANVMLTPEGGVKVLDFGLARPAGAPLPIGESTPDAGVPAAPTDATLPGGAASAPAPYDATARLEPGRSRDEDGTGTRLGALLGTPAYLSPEQAHGEPATTASDMYALGLLLQELFTGEPPHPPHLGTAELVARAQRVETLPVEGADRHVAALIADLLEASPAERPTAAEALRRLRWIQGKPRRRTIRWVAAAAVLLLLLGGLKYTLDLKAARDEADRRRAQAEDLIGYMLGDLRGKLSGVGRLDLLEDVGDKALDYYESLPLEDRTPDELARRAEALRQIGEVRIDQGDLEAADDAFGQALRISEGLVERDPERTDWLLGLAHAHFWLGNVEWLRGDLDPSLARFEAYREIAERLAAAEPDATEWQLERAYAYTNLAAVRDARGEEDAALEALDRSIEVKRDLVEEDPTNAEWRASLANGLSWQGSQREDRGELRGALDSHTEELRMRRDLIADDSRNVEARYLLTHSLSHGGRLYLFLGELDRARSLLVEALDLSKGLVAHDPTNLDWLRRLGVAHRDLGELRSVAGDDLLALTELTSATRIFEDLVDRDSSNSDWRDELIETHLLTCRASLGLARPGAADALQRAEELLDARRAAQPKLQQMRARADLLKARILERQNQPEAARKLYEAALETLAPLSAESRAVSLMDTWARALQSTGREREAAAVVDALLAAGYRRPDFLACCVDASDALPPSGAREADASPASSDPFDATQGKESS